MNEELKPITIDPPEKTRIYHFPNNEKVILNDVCELIVRPSGTHRLTTTDGKSHIIPSGWLHIELDIDQKWTV
jgi:hypothetical protein